MPRSAENAHCMIVSYVKSQGQKKYKPEKIKLKVSGDALFKICFLSGFAVKAVYPGEKEVSRNHKECRYRKAHQRR